MLFPSNTFFFPLDPVQKTNSSSISLLILMSLLKFTQPHVDLTCICYSCQYLTIALANLPCCFYFTDGRFKSFFL